MKLWSIGYEFVLSFVAAGFFAILLKAPRRTIPISAAIGALGWLLFRIMGGGLSAYFVATLCIAMAGEAAARIVKRPASLFIHAAVIPLVPGGGLYQTMLYLVNSQYDLGISEGTRTLLAMGLMAMAIGVAALLFKYIRIPTARNDVRSK